MGKESIFSRVAVFVILSIFFYSEITSAATPTTRKVFFSVVGRNKVTKLIDPQHSSCVVSITNNSTEDQNYTLNMTTSFYNNNSPLFPQGSNNSIASAPNTSDSITKGSSKTIAFDYPDLPTNTAYDQQVNCSGSITAQDLSGQAPGFLSASASLIVVNESVGTVAAGHGTQAILTPIPISINGGKPF